MNEETFLQDNSAEAGPQRENTTGVRVAHTLLWIQAAALVLFAAALAWAVTLMGGGWYLLGGALFVCGPLPLWYFLTDRRGR
ncbi:hypothetical protein [Streptomyces fulvoviolaceus]|uniref:hypothetical protein n=1 Tax=Streptomyces fulvoviolaceus TaxID=285535 RepID=UPI0004C9B54E|nr:hypothetical protein [Streptomyces fulvoviolaceus]MCT9077297.1 hypothetical protein [Streptomyces fulvoviolaceus]